MPQQPHLIHHLPIVTTLVAAGFLPILLVRAARRGWPPHLAWWAIGVACYGAGTALESIVTLRGNSPELNRWWYLAGAILGAWPLATGSVYLVLRSGLARTLTILSAVPLTIAGVALLFSPIDITGLPPHTPSGSAIGWTWIRGITPLVNLYAAVFLVGGAIWSSFQFQRRGGQRNRAIGTGLIAAGGLLPGIGGAMAKTGLVEALYVGELIGLVLIWAGYTFCVHAPEPTPVPQ